MKNQETNQEILEKMNQIIDELQSIKEDIKKLDKKVRSNGSFKEDIRSLEERVNRIENIVFKGYGDAIV